MAADQETGQSSNAIDGALQTFRQQMDPLVNEVVGAGTRGQTQVVGDIKSATATLLGALEASTSPKPGGGAALADDLPLPGPLSDDAVRRALTDWAKRSPLVPDDLFVGTLSASSAPALRFRFTRLIEGRSEQDVQTSAAHGVPELTYRLSADGIEAPPPGGFNAVDLTFLLEGSLAESPCAECGGRGDIVCSACNGTGWSAATSTQCYVCRGGRVPCKTCDATGIMRRYKMATIARRPTETLVGRPLPFPDKHVKSTDWVAHGPFAGTSLPSSVPEPDRGLAEAEIARSVPGELMRRLMIEVLPLSAVVYDFESVKRVAYIFTRDGRILAPGARTSSKALRWMSGGRKNSDP